MNDYMETLKSELRKVKAETAAVLAEESRTKRAWDECKAEINKLQAYADKAAQVGNDEDARKFLERKAAQDGKSEQLKAAYEIAAANSARMRQVQDKLMADMGQLGTQQQPEQSLQQVQNAPVLSAEERWEIIKAKRDNKP